EALSQKLIDYIAPSEEDLFRQMQGKTVKRFNGQTETLSLVGEPVRTFDMTLKQRILAFIMDPNIAFILLAIGALALYAEFNHPGAVVPGTVGVVFILLAVFALNLLHALRSRGADTGVLYSFCNGSQVRNSRCIGDRRNCHHGLRGAAPGGRAYS